MSLPDDVQLSTSLQPGDIVAFSIAPDATAADFYHPTFPARLQSMLFKKYLGLITYAEIKPAIMEDEEGNEFLGERQVEVYELSFIASTPPDDSMLRGYEHIASVLPDKSLSFASFPVDQPGTAILSESRRPPLRLLGDGALPFPQSFVYTANGPPISHLGALHHGQTRLRLADGELNRFERACRKDLDVIGAAHNQAGKILQQQNSAKMASSEAPALQDVSRAINNDIENRTSRPNVTHVVLNIWTDWKEIESFGHPSEFLKEVKDIDSALGASWEEAPQAITTWAEDVNREQIGGGGGYNDYSTASPSFDTWTSKAAFAVGLVVGVGAGVLGMILLRHIKIHK